MKKLILFLSAIFFFNLLKAEQKEDAISISNVNAVLRHAIHENDYERAKLLVENGADVNAKYVRDEYKVTVLYYALSKDRYKIAELLIKNGADVDEEYGKRYHEQTVLRYALSSNQYKMAEFLLENGADVNATYGSSKKTVFHDAVLNNDPDMVRFLTENGADVNAKNSFGDTALHYIISQLNHENHTERFEIAEFLIALNDANPQLRNNKGITPIDIYNKRNRGLYMSQQSKWVPLLNGTRGNPFGKLIDGFLRSL